MKHVFWLIPGRLAGRPGPDREAWDPAELRRAGIGAVLSVNDGLLCHAGDFARCGIAYRCIPLSPNAPPRAGDLEHCRQALPAAYAFVDRMLGAAVPTLVHCSSGKDRTGLFMAYHLARSQGMSPQASVTAVKEERPIAFSAPGWDEFALQVLAAEQSG